MREILFRGKPVGLEKEPSFVYGGYFQDQQGAYYIIDTNNDGDGGVDCSFIQVDPSTICQYTGLKDKNGKMIFEGDIIKTTNTLDEEQTTGIINFSELFKGFLINNTTTPLCIPSLYIYEILGNSIDNPELIP